MKNLCWTVCIVGVLLTAGVVSTLSARTGQDGGDGAFAIYVAPNMIVKSASCNWVTIHTDVQESEVDDVSVAVNGSGVEAASVFADDCGNIVVKLNFDDVVELVDPPTATITLTVVVDGEELVASAVVGVKD